MKKTLVAVLAICALSASAFAATPKPAHKMAAKTMTCPACKMAMPMKASAATPVPVKVGKKTYFCCADCAAGKKAAAMNAKMKMKMKMGKKPAM